MKTKHRPVALKEIPWHSAGSPRPVRRTPSMAEPTKRRVRIPLADRRGSVEYGPGTEADHEAVYQTLLHVFHGPDRDSFLGALSDPVYRRDTGCWPVWTARSSAMST